MSIKRPPGDLSFILVQRFGELIRKLWNPKNFKAHVSPHEMLQAVVLSSKKQFQITHQGDAVEFLKWLLNALHLADEYEWKVQDSPFLYLTTELPPPPLFKDEHHENIIPQVSL